MNHVADMENIMPNLFVVFGLFFPFFSVINVCPFVNLVICMCTVLIMEYSLFLRISSCRTQHGHYSMGKGVKIPETDEAEHSFCCSLYCGMYTALIFDISFVRSFSDHKFMQEF